MVYTVLGWDVGIKNLACCVVTAQSSTVPVDQMEVKHWEIINLCELPPTNTCMECGKNAKYYVVEQKEKLYYCGRHCDKSVRKDVKIPKIKRDLAVFGTNLKNELDKRKNVFLKNIDRVVIENQPSLQNPFMKSIQIMLYSWFLFHKMDVVMISASSKMKVYNGPPIETPNLKTKYAIRKRLSILQTRQLLKDHPNEIETMDQNKSKCDDLCDAYLLACFQILRFQQEEIKKNKKNRRK